MSKLKSVCVLRTISGFTLIEILIVIALFLLLSAASFSIYGNLSVSSQLDDAHSGILGTLRTARERAISRLNNSGHGVYFDDAGLEDRYILYQGPSYAARDIGYDRILTLDSSLSLSTDFPSNDINFSMGRGIPNATGTVTITHSVKGLKYISVNRFGIAE